MPHVEYGKDRVEEYKMEIQEILSVLGAPSSPLDEDFGVGKHTPRLVAVGLQSTSRTSGSKSGTPSALAKLRRFVQSTDALNLDTPACKRLISRAFALHELPSLIEEIFSSKDADDTISHLHGDDTQAFVDVIDEACPAFAHYESVHWI